MKYVFVRVLKLLQRSTQHLPSLSSNLCLRGTKLRETFQAHEKNGYCAAPRFLLGVAQSYKVRSDIKSISPCYNNIQ